MASKSLELRLLELRTEVRNCTNGFQLSLNEIDYERLKPALLTVQKDLMLLKNSSKFKKKIQILEEAVSKLLRQIEFCSPFKLQSETVNKLTKVNNVTQTNNELTQINNEKLHEINTCVPQTNNVLIYETKNIQGRTEPTHLNELVDMSEGYDSDRTEFEFPEVETKQSENNETAKNDEDSDCTEFEFPFKDMEKEIDISSERDQKENGNVTDIKTKHAILFQNTAHQGNQASGKTNSKETNLEAAKQNNNQDEIQQDGEKPNQPVTKDKNGTSAIENIKNSRDIENIDIENVHISVPHSPLLLKSFNRNRKNLSATCASNKYEHNGDHTFDKNKFELYSTMNTTLDSIFEIQTSPMQSKVIDSNKTDTNADTISFLCPVSGIFKVQGSLSELNKKGDRINQLEQTSDLLAQSNSMSETTKLKQMSKFNANMKKETIGILQKDGLTLATNRDQNKVEKENVEIFQHAKMIENGKLVNRSQPIISSKNRETNYKTTDTNANKGFNVQVDLNTRKTDPKEIQKDLFVPMKQSHEIPNDSPSAANSAERSQIVATENNINVHQTLPHKESQIGATENIINVHQTLPHEESQIGATENIINVHQTLPHEESQIGTTENIINVHQTLSYVAEPMKDRTRNLFIAKSMQMMALQTN
ncbi:hypothetical protein WDU94_010401 [Cyamophila willieti]